MQSAFERFDNVYEFSTERRLVALHKVKEQAAQMGAMHIVAHVARALEHDHKTRTLELAWNGRKSGQRPKSELPTIDLLVDQALAAVHNAALALTRGVREDDEIVEKVHLFLDEILPHGLYAVASLPYIEELAAVEAIMDKLEGELAPMVLELGLIRQVRRLRERVNDYRAAHLADQPETVEFARVREHRKRGQGYLLETIALIRGTYPASDDPDLDSARRILLAPIIEQNEAIRISARSRRNVRDGEADDQDSIDEPEGGQDTVAVEPLTLSGAESSQPIA